MTMRRAMTVLLFTSTICLSGCHRKYAVADVPILPDATMDEYEDKLGSPAREGSSHHWIEYGLRDGGVIRLYFFNGAPGGRRTLSHADVMTETGTLVKRIFEMKPNTTTPATTLPATTEPSSEATQPATLPTTTP